MDQGQQTERPHRLFRTGTDSNEEAVVQTDLLDRLMLLSRGLATGMPFERMLNDIATTAASVLQSEIVLLRQVTEDNVNFMVASAVGPAPLSTGGLVGVYSPVSDRARNASPGDTFLINLLDINSHPLLSAAETWSFQQLGAQHALLVPLFSGGVLTGRLDVLRIRNVPFDRETVAVAKLLAVFAAQALYTHSLEHAARENRVFQTVLGLHQSIEHLADPRTILQAVAELVLREPGADRCYAMLWDESRQEFVPTAVAGLEPHMVDMLKLVSLSPQVAPAFDQVMHSNRPLVVADATRSTLLPQSLVRALGIHAAMIVPLRGRHRQTIGFLLVDRSEPGVQFTEHQVSVLSGMARHLAAMIENAMLYEEAITSSATLSVVNEIGIQLAMLTDESSLFRQLHFQVGSAIDASYFALALLNEDRSKLEVWEADDQIISIRPEHINLNGDLLSTAIRTGRPTLTGARSGDTGRLPDGIGPKENYHSRITVPITVGRNVIGAMSVHSPYRHAYGPQDLELLSAIALHTGVAIENARLYQLTQARDDRRGVVLNAVMHRYELERKELVDDLHEDTLQTLAACLLQLDHAQAAARNEEPDGDVAAGLEHVRAALSGSIDRLRTRIFKLRPATLDVLGLEPALREYVRSLAGEQTGAISLETRLTGRLAPESETAIYRIFQEALGHVRLTNGIAPVTVRIDGAEGEVTIRVQLTGTPDAPAERTGDVGLMALIERVELAGGALEIDQEDPGGLSMLITVPVTGTPDQTNGRETNEDSAYVETTDE